MVAGMLLHADTSWPLKTDYNYNRKSTSAFSPCCYCVFLCPWCWTQLWSEPVSVRGPGISQAKLIATKLPSLTSLKTWRLTYFTADEECIFETSECYNEAEVCQERQDTHPLSPSRAFWATSSSSDLRSRTFREPSVSGRALSVGHAGSEDRKFARKDGCLPTIFVRYITPPTHTHKPHIHLTIHTIAHQWYPNRNNRV